MNKKFFLILVLSIFTPTILFAQEAKQSLSSRPAFPNKILPYQFSFEVKPGESAEDLVEVSNSSNQATQFIIVGVDSTTNQQGKKAFLLSTDEQKSAGAWVTPEFKELTLQPQEKKTLKVYINVPADAALGDYMAGLSVEAVNTGTVEKEGQVLRVNLRMVNTVNIKVTDNPQPIEKMPIPSPWPSPTAIYFFASATVFLAFLVYLGATQVKKHRAKKAAHPKK